MAGAMVNVMAAAEPPKRRAYVTFLAGADEGESLEAAVRLAEDLRKVGAAYPLVAAVLPDVPEPHRDVLVSNGCVVRAVEPVYQPENQNQFAMALGYVRVWEFVEYERIIYLDAKVHVKENIDWLFDLEKGHFYAAELGGPGAAAPYVNARIMFVHEPSAATAQALLDALRLTHPTSFIEQDFMNMFFRGKYKPIPLDHHLIQPRILGHYEDMQLDEAKLHPGAEREAAPPQASWFTTKVKNLPAMAALSLTAMGVISDDAANPVMSFCFFTAFIAAVGVLTFSIVAYE